MNLPRVSVLMPVFNCAPFLDDALNSIRRQSISGLEIIIVNDGSTDESLDVARAHAREDARIVVIDRPNRGIAATLNDGLAVCRGNYVARMDGDDIALPDRLARQAVALDADLTIGVIGGQVQAIDEQGKPIPWNRYSLTHEEIIAALHKGSYAMLHPTLMIRRELMCRIGGYGSQFVIGEDLDLLLKLAPYARMRNLDAVLLKYRVRAGSASQRRAHLCAYWDYVALNDAKLRGQPVEPHALARAADRISWTALDAREYRKGFAWAWRAFNYSPFSLCGVRAIARASMRWMKKSVRVAPVQSAAGL